jgi:hypothetical protein
LFGSDGNKYAAWRIAGRVLARIWRRDQQIVGVVAVQIDSLDLGRRPSLAHGKTHRQSSHVVTAQRPQDRTGAGGRSCCGGALRRCGGSSRRRRRGRAPPAGRGSRQIRRTRWFCFCPFLSTNSRPPMA